MTDSTQGPASVEPEAPLELREGAVAVIDALGFKGIWERASAARVIETLRSARECARGDFEWHNVCLSGGWDNSGMQVRFFSDTIVIVGTVPRQSIPQHLPKLGDVVVMVATAVMHIVTQALYREVPLLYRGCIAAGSFLAVDEFFVGPAIDEAAEWAEKAKAAVVWLRPSADVHVDASARQDHLLVPWDVPMANDVVRASIVNPLHMAKPAGREVFWAPNTIEEMTARYVAAFGPCDREDVIRKRENTVRALEVAARATAEFFANRPEPRPPSAQDIQELIFGSKGEDA